MATEEKKSEWVFTDEFTADETGIVKAPAWWADEPIPFTVVMPKDEQCLKAMMELDGGPAR